MIEDRILQSKVDEKINLKKFHLEIQIVEDRVLLEFWNMAISAKNYYKYNYHLKKIPLIIYRMHIYNILH